jgi:cardiolipin synthase A/B
LTGCCCLSILVMVVVIIMENQDPIKTLSWILVLFLVPLGGIILYIYFGVNPKKRKMIILKEMSDRMSLDRLIQEQMIRLNKKVFIRDQKLVPKRHLMKLLLNNSKALITEYNNVRVLTMDGKPSDRLFMNWKVHASIFTLSFISLRTTRSETG